MFKPSLTSAFNHCRQISPVIIASLCITLTACDKAPPPNSSSTTSNTSQTVPYQESAKLVTHASGDGSGKFNSGEEAYQKICAYCHDTGIGPVIKGRQLPPQMIEAIARSGLRAMPSFTQSFIDDESLKALGEYIQSSAAPVIPATAPVQGDAS